MSELKTKVNDADVSAFIDKVADEQKRKDSYQLIELMSKVSGAPPKMWGESIVGFGSYHYKYKSGREGDWMLCGFSPRKANISVYTMCDIEKNKDLLSKLGKYKSGKSCLYIKRLSDIDEKVLEQLVRDSIEQTKEMYS
ncbi:MAG: DUF1801 domain-containing protein [Chitinophagales bacterium]